MTSSDIPEGSQALDSHTVVGQTLASSAATRPPLVTQLHDWVTTVDHKRVGLLYLMMSLMFMVFGGIEALIIRVQLWTANNTLVEAETFNQLFTMHGTTMIFFVVMPMIAGFANFLVPLMIGARDVAFPRLNALGFWLSLMGGCTLYLSYFTGKGLLGGGSAPDVGWFAYAPLTSPAYSVGSSTDYWIVGTAISGIGTIAFAVNTIATIVTMRAPGMLISKVPLFVWMMLITSFMILLAFPPLTAAQVMLLMDRHMGAHFFDTQAGGSALLWQHLFWFFGHPEVYILALPAFGIISEIVPVFSRKVIFGYASVAMSSAAIGVIGSSVWAHHMFTVGMSDSLDAFFSATSFLIAVPTGIKVLNWTATLYGGQLRLRTPMLFALGFLGMFLMGGLTGIMLAAVPVDWQISDSYFLVGHFHYVLFGGSLFALMGGVYYWFPKATGRMLDDRLGKLNFWLQFIGFNLLFGPMHISGILGMPRRVYTYQPGQGWEIWNQISTVGGFIMGLAFLTLFWNLAKSLRSGKPAGDDPWDAWTLEWMTSSPPAAYNFEEIPTVRSRRPLWDLKHPEDPDWKHE
ncbi:cytochrome c oxidase subunit I [Planctomycetes bacterium TBK1r]|uniref:Cytochrome c oxidase subunit 1 n=1 Tax=Stieleria magnilauensis TaxID=2527963 RepID=A0ABX5XYV6_9BACT|nr:Cytochrome c oxidase subunit 1 [Planctomycetes bacterium TBK1r]